VNFKKLLFPALFIIIVSALFPNQAKADREVMPFDYAIFTEDKNYIFIMLAPPRGGIPVEKMPREGPPYYITVIYDSDESFGNGKEQERDSLRIKYPCSGLYKNDGSNKPIWTVDWYTFLVYLFPDGEHLIRRGPWNSAEFENEKPVFDGLAFAFYKNGIEVASYKVEDIVKDTSAISFTISHYFWSKDYHVDKSSGILYVETLDEQKYTYDVRKIAASIKGRETSCTPNHKYVSKTIKNFPKRKFR
jgi:hypothetical protein